MNKRRGEEKITLAWHASRHTNYTRFNFLSKRHCVLFILLVVQQMNSSRLSRGRTVRDDNFSFVVPSIVISFLSFSDII